MTVYTVTIAVSVLVFIAIGSYSGRKVKDIDDYFVAGRRAPTLLIVGTLVASVFSTSIFLGDIQQCFSGVGCSIQHHVLDSLFQLLGDVGVNSQLPCIDDTHIHTGMYRMV